MKVCLIEPPKFVSLTNFVSTISMPPIGLAYIAAAIREEGHAVAYFGGSKDEIQDKHMANRKKLIREGHVNMSEEQAGLL